MSFLHVIVIVSQVAEQNGFIFDEVVARCLIEPEVTAAVNAAKQSRLRGRRGSLPISSHPSDDKFSS